MVVGLGGANGGIGEAIAPMPRSRITKKYNSGIWDRWMGAWGA